MSAVRNRRVLTSALACLALLASLAGCAIPRPAPQPEPSPSHVPSRVIHVAPDGSGAECTAAAPCSLDGGQQQARSAIASSTRDVIVSLADGVYELESPFTLTAADSGQGGHRVVYRAADGARPLLSGGRHIAGWQLVDPGNGIYRASVPIGTQSRQFYVDGRRAVRARSEDNPAGWSLSSRGFELDASQPAPSFARPADLEFVGVAEWRHFRCPVSAIADHSVMLADPCVDNSRIQDLAAFRSVAWIENARELLDEPGEWYLDAAESAIYYLPRPGEDLATADAVLPILETLVQVEGTSAEPLHDIAFEGIGFAYATWLRPSTGEGYAPVQAGYLFHGDAALADATTDTEKVPGNIRIAHAAGIEFADSRFEHLGAAAVTIGEGARDVRITRSSIDDVSASGIAVGDALLHHPAEPDQAPTRVTISDNSITRIGVEYFDAVGISDVYSDSTVISHNGVFQVPYSGISLGWGWGVTDSGGAAGFDAPTPAHAALVEGNEIGAYLQQLRDGGGIYTLGDLSGAVVWGNHIHSGNRDGSAYVRPDASGALYLDEATRGVTVTGNVVEGAANWLFLWTPSIRGNLVAENFSDTGSLVDRAPDNAVRDNWSSGGPWPAGAEAVMAAAGPRPSPAH
ncbi:hypothetical protein ACFSBZ_14095 [Amnibacterium flavum]|uniref:right-handed parallel beta-helix repeat-containing protein n=1 Tax=Amnibacterium flavum TaxID=2173173 RepID=UPI001401FB8E|nr:right-handed parallel beta-helix repeat-containing protein [Amnibacterium flavum]